MTEHAITADFKFCWLNDERTRLSVRYTGAISTVIDHDGNEVEDAGLVQWPSDSEISKACGKEVVFADAGDDLTEAIFRTASSAAGAALGRVSVRVEDSGSKDKRDL